MEKKLFIVEFGKPENTYASSSLHVIASSFDEAVEKAKVHLDSKESSERITIINKDGDLVLPQQNDIWRVKAVKVIADEIIW
jgi:hypothetical protein